MVPRAQAGGFLKAKNVGGVVVSLLGFGYRTQGLGSGTAAGMCFIQNNMRSTRS